MKLGVVGTGLIGASLIDAAYAAGAVESVHVLDREPDNVRLVRARHKSVVEVDDVIALAQCDIVFICTPPESIAAYVGAFSSSPAIIVDAGSTKSAILRQVAAEGGNPRFVPGHPLSGGTSSGPAEARASIITRRSFILCPYPTLDPDALQGARNFIERIGAEVMLVDADAHDRVLALTSHLPHLLAFSLIDALRHLPPEEKELAERLLPNSFLTVTRFALSDPAMWAGISAQNSDNIGSAATVVQQSLRRLIDGSTEEGEKALAELQKLRQTLE